MLGTIQPSKENLKKRSTPKLMYRTTGTNKIVGLLSYELIKPTVCVYRENISPNDIS